MQDELDLISNTFHSLEQADFAAYVENIPNDVC